MKTNSILKTWIEEMAALCLPDNIVWIDGSIEQRDQLRKEACASGEIIELDQKKFPGCYYHRTDPNDVARTEDKTFICTRNPRDVGSTNNWKDTEEAYTESANFFRASMRNRTMYVIPFSMGPIGSPFSKIGVELTDSIYVVLNMLIMTRVGNDVLDVLGDSGDFTKCLHSKANLDLDKRRILHFPEDNAIWSVNSGYGATFSSERNVSPSDWPASWPARKDGWPNTCSLWESKNPMGASIMWPPLFPAPAEKQI